MKKYSDSDIIREYNKSTNSFAAAQKLGISVNEVKRALLRANICSVEVYRTEADQEWYDAGLGKDDFIDDDNII